MYNNKKTTFFSSNFFFGSLDISNHSAIRILGNSKFFNSPANFELSRFDCTSYYGIVTILDKFFFIYL